MDNRDSLDRSSTEVPLPPAIDGYPPYNPNGDSNILDGFHQPPPNASENETSGAVDAVLQSDVPQDMSYLRELALMRADRSQHLAHTAETKRGIRTS